LQHPRQTSWTLISTLVMQRKDIDLDFSAFGDQTDSGKSSPVKQISAIHEGSKVDIENGNENLRKAFDDNDLKGVRRLAHCQRASPWRRTGSDYENYKKQSHPKRLTQPKQQVQLKRHSQPKQPVQPKRLSKPTQQLQQIQQARGSYASPKRQSDIWSQNYNVQETSVKDIESFAKKPELKFHNESLGANKGLAGSRFA
jgi:hypothetical protein